MKWYRFLTGSIFKFLFVWNMIAFLTLSTTLESLSLLTENSFEIEHIDWQEDTSEESEKEKKEDTKIHNFFKSSLSFLSTDAPCLNNFFQAPASNIFLEIHLPPPRQT
ncbi:hypothetical protein OAP80_02130 [Flavobacteriaceae bacterium]|nr:hypothetical protein [Flavobacteriaceae bacterium]